MLGTVRRTLSAVRNRTWLTFLLLWIATAAAASAWAMATPMSASPDEPSHIIKAAAVAHGELLGERTDREGFVNVEIPRGLAKAWTWACAAYEPSQPASCLPDFENDGELTTAVTSAGLYNPVYYAMVGWPSLVTDNPRIAVYGMRVVSAIVVSFFFAVAMTALLLFKRPLVAALASFAVLTPTTLFLAGSVNPNALEVATGSALLAVLLLLVRGPGVRHRTALLGIVAVSGVLLANTRGLSPLWMAAIAVIAVVSAPWPRLQALLRLPAVWATIATLALGVAFAAWWLVYSETLGSMGSFAGAGSTPPIRAFFVMLLERSLDPGMVGLFGWLDTYAPQIAFVVWSCLALGLVLAAFLFARGRLIAGLVAALAMFFLIPPIVQAASVENSGYIWQGRYTLVALACLIVMAAIATMQAMPAFTTRSSAVEMRALLIVGVLVAVVQCFTLLYTTKRYAVGIDGWWGDFFLRPLWLPPLGALSWVLLTALAFATLIAVASAWILGTQPSTNAEAIVDDAEPSTPATR